MEFPRISHHSVVKKKAWVLVGKAPARSFFPMPKTMVTVWYNCIKKHPCPRRCIILETTSTIQLSSFPCLEVAAEAHRIRSISIMTTQRDLHGRNLHCSWHHPTDILKDLSLTWRAAWLQSPSLPCFPLMDVGVITEYRAFTTCCWSQLDLNTNLKANHFSLQKLSPTTLFHIAVCFTIACFTCRHDLSASDVPAHGLIKWST